MESRETRLWAGDDVTLAQRSMVLEIPFQERTVRVKPGRLQQRPAR